MHNDILPYLTRTETSRMLFPLATCSSTAGSFEIHNCMATSPVTPGFRTGPYRASSCDHLPNTRFLRTCRMYHITCYISVTLSFLPSRFLRNNTLPLGTTRLLRFSFVNLNVLGPAPKLKGLAWSRSTPLPSQTAVFRLQDHCDNVEPLMV